MCELVPIGLCTGIGALVPSRHRLPVVLPFFARLMLQLCTAYDVIYLAGKLRRRVAVDHPRGLQNGSPQPPPEIRVILLALLAMPCAAHAGTPRWSFRRLFEATC